MQTTIENLMEKIQDLEKSLLFEMQKKQDEYFYEIVKKKVRFESEIRKQHRRLKKKLYRYLYEASFLNILTAPVIWSILIPAVLMDLFITVYQTICFPAYRIPRVRRGDYIVIDRNYLSYLNSIEKLNCMYCSYFNGLIAYVREVAARTEQYWCPIKHARKLKVVHDRYKYFFDYGDATGYRQNLGKVRHSFDDLKNADR